MSTIAVSKSERAYAAIKQSITEGAYGPGYRLVLGQIAKELDVSVVPVREAIRRLEAEGLVTFTTNVGAQVVAVDAATTKGGADATASAAVCCLKVTRPSATRTRAGPRARARARA